MSRLITPHQKQHGYTLLELLFTLSILAILVSSAVSSFAPIIERTRSQATLNQLFTELHFARNMAVSSQTTVTVCGTNNGQTCDKNWTEKLLIFNDENRDQIWQNTEVLYRESYYGHPEPIIFRVSRGRDGIRFKYTGMAMEFGSINDCLALKQNPSTTSVKTLVLSRVGRSRLASNYAPSREVEC